MISGDVARPRKGGRRDSWRCIAAAAWFGVPLNAQQCDWQAASAGGFTSRVLALGVLDHGAGPSLYAGGIFRQVLGSPVSFIGRLNEGEWAPLGDSVGGPVHAMLALDQLYVAGAFGRAGTVQANGVARWDGEAWSALGVGLYNTDPNQPMRAMALAHFDDGSGPALYVGGNFDEAGGKPVSSIARWDGHEWSSVGEGLVGTEVRALAVHDDGFGPALYAGGWTIQPVSRWDGKTWAPVEGLDNIVNALAVFDDGSGPALYAGGQISGGIARWDGESWSTVGGGTDFTVHSLHVHDDGAGPALFVGGAFIHAGGIPVLGIARWDGASWSPLGGGLYDHRGSNGQAMTTFDDGSGPALYVGGHFTHAGGFGGVPADNIARWRCETCYPDCDGSGSLDIFDFLCFQDAFVSKEPYADCDRNSAFDIFDFLCFQDAFIAGCP